MKPKFIFSIAFLIASCTSKQLDSNNIPVPTVSIEGTQTSLAPLISTPQPTTTKSPVDKIFSLPTYGVYPNSTPTTIATPNYQAFNARLRDLDEKDYLILIENMHSYSYKHTPPFLGWWDESNFIASQEPVALAVQEYLYHYPESPYADRLHWQLAFNDIVNDTGEFGVGIPGNIYNDKWIVDELEKELNAGLMPDDLKTFLDQYWLEVEYYQPINNLFGDGKMAWFYVISPQVWAEEDAESNTDFFGHGGLFIAVRETEQGIYKIYTIDNSIGFVTGESSIFEISDFNKNGIPEIALNIWYHGGTMCGGNFRIYEYYDEGFKDLTNNEIEIYDCIDHYEYIQVDNRPGIRLTRFLDNAPFLFRWDGEYYRFYKREAVDAISELNISNTFEDQIIVINEILNSNPDKKFSLAEIDYLRFRLGVAYAMTGMSAEAQETFQGIVNAPADKSRTVYSDLSRSFLNSYSGDQSLFEACRRSREKLINLWAPYSPPQEIESKFGVAGDISTSYPIGLLRCFGNDVFSYLISKMPINITNLDEYLQKYGIKTFYSERVDINSDGMDNEWLVLYSDGLFVVALNEESYEIVDLDTRLFTEVTEQTKTNVVIKRWSDIKMPVIITTIDNEVELYTVSENFKPNSLVWGSAVSNFVLFDTDSLPSFSFDFIEPKPEVYYPTMPWEGYRWDVEQNKFQNDLFEYTIFVLKDTDKAVEMANNLIIKMDLWTKNQVDSWSFPRYYYLCGVAYELFGDNDRAAEIYWRLWHDYPESQYALLASYKLEPSAP